MEYWLFEVLIKSYERRRACMQIDTRTWSLKHAILVPYMRAMHACIFPCFHACHD